MELKFVMRSHMIEARITSKEMLSIPFLIFTSHKFLKWTYLALFGFRYRYESYKY